MNWTAISRQFLVDGLKRPNLFSELKRVVFTVINSGMIINDAVRPIESQVALARRLQSPRYGYALVHPDDPGRPLAATFCALWKGPLNQTFLPSVLDAEFYDCKEPDSLIFYSLNSYLPGLGLAEKLLQNVMQLHEQENLAILTFSPIPDYRKLKNNNVSEEVLRDFLLNQEDRVARFHLQNGAHLHSLIRDGDMSATGRQQSDGWQASYRYA